MVGALLEDSSASRRHGCFSFFFLCVGVYVRSPRAPAAVSTHNGGKYYEVPFENLFEDLFRVLHETTMNRHDTNLHKHRQIIPTAAPSPTHDPQVVVKLFQYSGGLHLLFLATGAH